MTEKDMKEAMDMINYNFDYDNELDITNAKMEYNDFEWNGSRQGIISMLNRHRMVREFEDLCLKEGVMSYLEYVTIKRIFSLEEVDGAHFLSEECDGAFEMQVDKYFILKLADELREYAEEKM